MGKGELDIQRTRPRAWAHVRTIRHLHLADELFVGRGWISLILAHIFWRLYSCCASDRCHLVCHRYEHYTWVTIIVSVIIVGVESRIM